VDKFDYDMHAAERGFYWEKFFFTQQDWKDYERDYERNESIPDSETVDTVRTPERRMPMLEPLSDSEVWLHEIGQEVNELEPEEITESDLVELDRLRNLSNTED
jgi:hypothetical protein